MIITKIRSLLWADFFLYSLVDPRLLYRQIGKNDPRPFLLSFTVPAISTISGILALSLLGKQTSFFYTKITYGWILLFIWESFKIVILAGLMDMACQFQGSRGNIREMVSLLNFSLFPQALILPTSMIFSIINFAPVFMFVLFSLVLFVWSAWIAVIGISEMHSIQAGRTVIIFIFPYLFISIVFFFMGLLSLISLVGYITT